MPGWSLPAEAQNPARRQLLDDLRASWPARVAREYGRTHASAYASGVAFNALLTMFPLILGVLAVLGLVLRSDSLRAQATAAILSSFPQDSHAQIADALNGVRQGAGVLGIVSIAGTIFTGTNLFGSLEFALGQTFGSSTRSFLRQRAMGLVMTVIFVLVVVGAIAANAIAGAVPGSWAFGPLAAMVLLLALFVAMYRFVPNRAFGVRAVLPGALASAVLIELCTLLFPLYARVSHGFSAYGQQFALFFLLAAWFGLLSQAMLLGAVIVHLDRGTPPPLRGIAASPAHTGPG